MLTLDLEDFLIEIDEGTVKHVGASNRSATAKLYDVEGVDVREFGDDRVKIGFDDGDGNEVEVALGADAARQVARGLELLEEEGALSE